MKLYPDACSKFVLESGRIRTPASERSFMKTMHVLQTQIDHADAADYTTDELTAWCLSNEAAPSTIRKRRAHARSLFGWLQWKGIIPDNPASALEYSVQPGRGSARSHTWLSKNEMVELMRAMPDDEAGQRDRLVVLFGALCGLRSFEIAQIRWSHFSHGLSRLDVVGKGSKPVTIGVPPELVEALTAWRRRAPAGADVVLPTMRWVYDPALEKRVRHANWSCGLQYHGILYAITAAGERVDVKLRPHDLRRTYAGMLEEAGVPVSDIQRMMRHSDVGTTSRYLEKNPRKAAELADRFTLGL